MPWQNRSGWWLYFFFLGGAVGGSLLTNILQVSPPKNASSEASKETELSSCILLCHFIIATNHINFKNRSSCEVFLRSHGDLYIIYIYSVYTIYIYIQGKIGLQLLTEWNGMAMDGTHPVKLQQQDRQTILLSKLSSLS